MVFKEFTVWQGSSQLSTAQYDQCCSCGTTHVLWSTKEERERAINMQLSCARFWAHMYPRWSPHLWDVNFIILISRKWGDWITKHFVYGYTANDCSGIPFFMEKWRRLHHLSWTAVAISKTQNSRTQTIPHTIDYSVDSRRMWELFTWRSLRARCLFTQELVLEIGPVLILLFYIFLLSTKKRKGK